MSAWRLGESSEEESTDEDCYDDSSDMDAVQSLADDELCGDDDEEMTRDPSEVISTCIAPQMTLNAGDRRIPRGAARECHSQDPEEGVCN